MPTPAAIFQQTIEHFTTEFLHNPYLYYTEHGLHARFYAQLYHALAPDQRYLTWQGQRVCVVQKEYPTAHMNLRKSHRQTPPPNPQLRQGQDPLRHRKCPRHQLPPLWRELPNRGNPPRN